MRLMTRSGSHGIETSRTTRLSPAGCSKFSGFPTLPLLKAPHDLALSLRDPWADRAFTSAQAVAHQKLGRVESHAHISCCGGSVLDPGESHSGSELGSCDQEGGQLFQAQELSSALK